MALRTASDVQLLGPLKSAYAGYGDKAQSSLTDALGRITNQADTSRIATGRPVSQYQPFALDQAHTMASQGINDSLGAGLGESSLKDMIAQQEFERNMELAKRIGNLNAPNNLQMALGAATGAASLYGKYKGFKGSPSSFPSTGNSGLMPDPRLNLYGGSY